MAGQVSGMRKAAAPGFVVELENGMDRIRIPARRRWYLTLVTVLPLVVATLGELVGFALVSDESFDWFGAGFFLVWTGFWLAKVHAFAGLFWMRETIGVSGGAIEARFGLWPAERVRRFDATAIRHLKAGTPDDFIATLNPVGFAALPLTNTDLRLRRGAVSFVYKGRTRFIAHDLEEEQGREVVAWLATRLPSGAVRE